MGRPQKFLASVPLREILDAEDIIVLGAVTVVSFMCLERPDTWVVVGKTEESTKGTTTARTNRKQILGPGSGFTVCERSPFSSGRVYSVLQKHIYSLDKSVPRTRSSSPYTSGATGNFPLEQSRRSFKRLEQMLWSVGWLIKFSFHHREPSSWKRAPAWLVPSE